MKTRQASGSSIAEFGVVLALGLPLLLVLVYVGVTLTQFFAIQSNMDVAARSMARAMVVYYNNNPTGGTPGIGTVPAVLIPNYVANQNQYTATWDAASPPTYVQVTCKYAGGSYGLQPFPNGPLRFLATTFNLGTFQVSSNVTMPVQ